MFDFPTKSKPENKTAADNGKQFLAQAKEKHQELFESFAENKDEYDDFEDFLGALESQTWELLELVCKASYRNGIKRGQRRQKSDR